MGEGGKIHRATSSLTEQQRQEIGLEIERLIKNEMSFIVQKYIREYWYALYDTFGWTKEDILQLIRIRLWRGLATFDETKKFKKTTYCSAILFNYFLTLSKRCKSKKNALSKLLPVEKIYDSMDETTDGDEVHNNIYREESYEYFISKLSPFEIKVFRLYFLTSETPETIIIKTMASPKKINDTIKYLRTTLESHLQEMEDEEEGEDCDEF